jgi:hypothetical protein
MSHLLPCPSCSRHVRASEQECPFCGEALSLAGIPAPPLPTTRLGRAATFAFGATLIGATSIVACGGDSEDGDDSGTGGTVASGGTSGKSGTGGTAGAPATGATGGVGSAGPVYGAPAVGGGGGMAGGSSGNANAGVSGSPQPIYGAAPSSED